MVFGLMAFVFLMHSAHAQAATNTVCAPSADYGTVTSPITVGPDDGGQYRIWSRMLTPSGTGSIMIQIDTTSCYTINTNSTSWAWVDYEGGTSTAKANVTLSAGTHQIKMLGNSDGVQLDRIIFTKVSNNSTCTPDPNGKGDDCANPPDTTNPNIANLSPASGTVSGTKQVTATVSDDRAVAKVELSACGTVVNTVNLSPAAASYAYSYNWATPANDGPCTLSLKVTDTSGNVATSTSSVTVANGKPDFIVTGVTLSPSSPNVGQQVTLAATIKNQGSVAAAPSTTSWKVDGASVGTLNDPASLGAGSSRTETLATKWTATAGTHTILAEADSGRAVTESDELNNTFSTSVAVNSPDTTAPNVSITAPTNGATGLKGTIAIIVTATDNTGGSGMSRVEYYLNGSATPVGSSGTAPYGYSWVTTTNGTYSIVARAYDVAGNFKDSTPVSVTLANTTTTKQGDANGDSKVDIFDLSTVLSHWNQSGGVAQGNVNGDSIINIFDLSMVLSNWGK